MKLARFMKYMLLTILMVINTSCQTEQIGETQLQLVRYSLKKTDLPGGWKFGGKDWSVDFGGESYSVLYEIDPLVFIGHTIAMYANDAQSQEAYKEWEAKWFDVSMNVEPVISYSPMDAEDEWRYECLQTYPNDPILFCIYLQRHKEIVNFVRISSDSNNKNSLTSENVVNLLSILDQRLNEVIVEKVNTNSSP